MNPEHWISPVIVVSAIAGFVIGAVTFYTSGILEGRHREQLDRLRYMRNASSGYTEFKYERRVESTGSPMPTRKEVREAALRESANAAALDWQCHDNRCDGKGKHRCHNLDCKAHKVQA